jgi:hypothetical protein
MHVPTLCVARHFGFLVFGPSTSIFFSGRHLRSNPSGFARHAQIFMLRVP